MPVSTDETVEAAPAEIALTQDPAHAPRRRGAVRTGMTSQAARDAEAARAKTVRTANIPYERRDMPTDREALVQLRSNAQLASFPYHRDADRLPPGWQPDETLAGTMRSVLACRSGTGVQSPDGTIIDAESALTAVLLRNKETRELVVSLGGTSAGKHTGETLAQRFAPGANFVSSLKQWGANFKAAGGGVPQSYARAAALLRTLQSHAKADPSLKDYRIRLVGHSKGAGEAMYASLNAATPVRVTAFCPAHLHDSLVKSAKDRIAETKELIESFSPQGDIVPALRGWVPSMHGIGIGHHFAGIQGRNPVDLHDQFHEHVQAYCDGMLKPQQPGNPVV